MDNQRTSVIINGAGPTGLALACQLERYGVDFIILDRNEKTTHLSKAMAVHARTLEIFHEIGLAEKAIDLGQIATEFTALTNGKVREHIQLGNFGQGLTQFPFVLILEQSKTESLMAEYLAVKGKHVQWNSEFIKLEEMENEVTVNYKNKDGEEQKVVADYLVGCDGAGSLVRHQLGFTFEGDTQDELFFVADVKIKSSVFNEKHLYIDLVDDGFVVIFPMKDERHYRIIGVVPEDLKTKEKLAFDDFKPVIKQQIKAEFEFEETYWFSSYRVHSRRTNSFGRGRCYIAGDAAHIHTPAGGQGMNTGIQDAYNLAWKLAFVFNGKADTSLLNSYDIERLENASNLLKTTDAQFDRITSDGIFGKFFRLHLLPFVIKIVTKASLGYKTIFPILSMIGIKYPNSPLTTKSHVGKIHAGDRMPYFLYKEESIYEQLKSPNFKVVSFGNPPALKNKFSNFKNIQVDVIPDLFHGEKNFYILLRPDNHIAYIGKDIANVELLGL